jgi:nucleoside-diphosphate-sugar epimerase
MSSMSGDPALTRSVVAVTGASGFVGGAVADHLESLGHVVHRFGRRPVERVPEAQRASYRSWDIERGPLHAPPAVDAVVHCAAAVDDWGRPATFRRANVEGTRSVLATWPGARFVHISSGSVYDPRARPAIVHEDQADPTDTRATEQVRWLNAYGRTKREAEHVVAADHARSSIILRPHAIYGPGDTQLLPRLLRRVRFGRLMMVGSPDTRISLTHIDNLAHAVALAVEGEATGAFNVADPTAPPLDDCLRTMLRRLGRPERVAYLPLRAAWAFAGMAEAVHLYGWLPRPIVTRYQLSHVAHDFVYDLTKARTELGYAPRIDLPAGLETVDVPRRVRG